MMDEDPGAVRFGAAQRPASVEWRPFVRAIVEALGARLQPEASHVLLREVGGRVAALMPLPECTSLSELEARMNSALAVVGWGSVQLSFDGADRSLLLVHQAAPTAATVTDPGGAWFSSVLEGLYERWLGAQPGAEPSLKCRADPAEEAGVVLLRYSRA